MSKRKSRQFRGKRCLNCETALDISEKYCHQCGQLNSTKKLTIADFFEEFLSNFYAYDSRLKNSIVSIFTKPGILAKEFNEGKRQKYANPFRLFLSVSIVLFIVISFSNNNINYSKLEFNKLEISAKQFDSLKNNKHLSVEKNKEKYSLLLHKDSIYNYNELSINEASLLNTLPISSFRNFNLKYPNKTTEESLKELKFENNFLNRAFFDKAKTFKSNNINGEVKEYFNQKLPLLIFVSLPFLTIMFWLVFYSKSKNYTEHLVFTYTFYTFLFIGILIFKSISLISDNISRFLQSISFLVIFPIYFYKSLRNFYQYSRWKTVLKFILLNILFLPFIITSFIIIFLLGVLFF